LSPEGYFLIAPDKSLTQTSARSDFIKNKKTP